MKTKRTYTLGDHARIKIAVGDLKNARDLLSKAGAVKASAKVREALKSAEGAERHVSGKLDRAR